MKNYLFIFSIAALLASCETPPYHGYTPANNGLHYKIFSMGEGQRHPAEGDVATFDLTTYTVGDTLLSQSDSVIHALKNLNDGRLDQALSMLFSGDSAAFIYADSGSTVQIKHVIKLTRLQTAEEHQAELDYIKWKSESIVLEDQVLDSFLLHAGLSWSDTIGGVWFIHKKKGKGDFVGNGSVVTIHYVGYFLDSTVFDSSYEADMPLEFNFGDPEQVIKGIEVGLTMMKKGGIAKIIIPSRLAFGESGSSSGIVPPYTPVMFDVEVIDKK